MWHSLANSWASSSHGPGGRGPTGGLVASAGWTWPGRGDTSPPHTSAPPPPTPTYKVSLNAPELSAVLHYGLSPEEAAARVGAAKGCSSGLLVPSPSLWRGSSKREAPLRSTSGRSGGGSATAAASSLPAAAAAAAASLPAAAAPCATSSAVGHGPHAYLGEVQAPAPCLVLECLDVVACGGWPGGGGGRDSAQRFLVPA